MSERTEVRIPIHFREIRLARTDVGFVIELLKYSMEAVHSVCDHLGAFLVDLVYIPCQNMFLRVIQRPSYRSCSV